MKASQITHMMNTLQMSNDHFDKETYKKEFVRVLRNFAKKNLGLDTSEYKVTFNPGGQMSEGEAILHTENVYVSVAAREHMGKGHQVLYRKCNGMKDCTGGANHWCDSDVFDADKIDAFATKLKNL